MSHSKTSKAKAAPEAAAARASSNDNEQPSGDEYVQQYITNADPTQLKTLAIQLRDECHRRGLAWITVQAPD